MDFVSRVNPLPLGWGGASWNGWKEHIQEGRTAAALGKHRLRNPQNPTPDVTGVFLKVKKTVLKNQKTHH